MTKDYFILTVTNGRGAYSAAVPYHLATGETDEWGAKRLCLDCAYRRTYGAGGRVTGKKLATLFTL